MITSVTGSQITLFLLVLARVGGLVLSAPLIGDAQVPRLVKASLAIILSFVLAGLPNVSHALVPTATFSFVLLVIVQLVIGLALGFVARVLFFAVQTAAEIVSLQIGLSMATILNPLSRENEPVLSQLYMIIAALTFLAVHGDLWMVASLARSFDLAPVTTNAVSGSFVQNIVNAALTVPQLGLQIALPIGASLFVATAILGVVSRSLPQLNVFVQSLPVNFMVGLVVLIGSLAGLLVVISRLTGQLPYTMTGLTLHVH